MQRRIAPVHGGIAPQRKDAVSDGGEESGEVALGVVEVEGPEGGDVACERAVCLGVGAGGRGIGDGGVVARVVGEGRALGDEPSVGGAY